MNSTDYPAAGDHDETAVFAGGCFWCLQGPFEHTDGVKRVRVGYTGGHTASPTYDQVSTGNTGHREAVEIVFDPRKTGYSALLDIFLQQIDPTDPGGQFADRGPQYKTAIFYHDERQKKLAQQSIERIDRSGKFSSPVATEVLPAARFYEAESYHQAYYLKNPERYQLYKSGSGREAFVKKNWGEENLRGKLTGLQYMVTKESATEPPFRNEYWNNKEDGIYVDVISGDVLFTSKEKYDSGSGWPSFTAPADPAKLETRDDMSFGELRTEVRSKASNSHLGHVFRDGPPPTGDRYCINSAALRFIPLKELDRQGYGEYKHLWPPNLS
jgi:peptide methionine sulfoxide reductase msrA/msrB